MCLGAIYWARPARVVYAATRMQAADAGFDDDFIYRELVLPVGARKIRFDYLWQSEAEEAFRLWKGKGDKSLY
jgi:tRNA(Arg) A34 adenosine deaminase TadA